MKKNILNLGKALNKAEQKSINGGAPGPPECCNPTYYCCYVNPDYNGSNCQFLYEGKAGCV